jgi:hypothetical protein
MNLGEGWRENVSDGVGRIFFLLLFYSILVNLQYTHVRSFGYLVNVLREEEFERIQSGLCEVLY